MELKPFCSIVILNYNGEKLLPTAISSLLHLDYPQENLEIIIVDNNSQDSSRKIIKDFSLKKREIKYVFLDNNCGFAKGNNAGIKQAKGKYIILLNNDCVVDENWLKELVKEAEKDKLNFAIASKIMLSTTKKIQNAGIIVFQDGSGRDIGAVVHNNTQDYETDFGQYDQNREIYAACGAAVLYRKDILEKIGYLDEFFFMYYEDVEIAERARLHGFKIGYAPTAVVYHHHALSSKEWSPFFIYHTEKGRLLHVFYHFPIFIFISEYCRFFLTAVLRVVIQRNWQYFKVCFFFLTNSSSLIMGRLKKHAHISKGSVQKNYQQILSGYWYFS